MVYFLVNPPVSHIMAHQQQSQPMHAQHIAYSHPATQQVQQPIQYVVPQHYSQIASPLNSNVQATPVLHGIQRPPTPSQHPVHSATPPMHPGQQMFYGANQMTGINMQPQTTFVGKYFTRYVDFDCLIRSCSLPSARNYLISLQSAEFGTAAPEITPQGL